MSETSVKEVGIVLSSPEHESGLFGVTMVAKHWPFFLARKLCRLRNNVIGCYA